MISPLQFIAKQGIVLESGSGHRPSLAEAVAGSAISGSWWKHPMARAIFRSTRAARDCEDVLVCRLIDGKITYVHRRLWPAVVRLAKHFEKDRLASIREEHTSTGAHKLHTVPFPQWVPADITAAAKALSDSEAERQLGEWTLPSRKTSTKIKPRKSG
jgi:hypothetical protein